MIEIEIPGEYVNVCHSYHSGIDCMLYAIASTGDLTLGTHRPLECDTDEKWHLSLWRELSGDIAHAVSAAEFNCDNYSEDDEIPIDEYVADLDTLREFERWVDETIVPNLEAEYGLEDW